MKRNYLILLISFFIAGTSNRALAQTDTAVKKERTIKNIVRYNITNPLIFGGKSMIFGYERVLGKHQSASINVGQFTLPKLSLINLSSTDSIQVSNSSSESGYNISVDYRFYLKNENKHNAPRGVYIGPYYSHIHFDRTNTWTLNANTFSTNLAIDINAVGAELGYQFILWKRMAIDLILIGPGMANYSFKTKLDTSLDPDEEAEVFQKINDYLADKIPGYSLVIDDAEYVKTGNTNTTTFGFRYMIHLGFCF